MKSLPLFLVSFVVGMAGRPAPFSTASKPNDLIFFGQKLANYVLGREEEPQVNYLDSSKEICDGRFFEYRYADGAYFIFDSVLKCPAMYGEKGESFYDSNTGRGLFPFALPERASDHRNLDETNLLRFDDNPSRQIYTSDSNDYLFGNGVGSSSLSEESVYFFSLFNFLTYLDGFKDDDVIPESHDWVTVHQNLNLVDPITTGPATFLSLLENPEPTCVPTWVETNYNYLGYQYSSSLWAPFGPIYTMAQFICDYLTELEYVEDSYNNDGEVIQANDFRILTAEYAFAGHGQETVVATAAAELVLTACINDYPCLFSMPYTNTSGGEGRNYLFFVEEAEVIVFGETFVSFQGWDPSGFVAHFSAPYVSRAMAVDFHGMHAHSNNIQEFNTNNCKCGCNYEFASVPPHEHEFHYVRINNSVHRKYCSGCDYSIIEPHSGNWCICQLLNNHMGESI